MAATNPLTTLLSQKRDRPLFMAHMIAGYPTIETTQKVAEGLVRGGADILEVQIPFSDPMADGPTIAVACEEALAKGLTVEECLRCIEEVAKLGKPVAVISYINPIFRYGIAEFVARIKKVQAAALIVPDCPFDTEEGLALLDACEKEDIALIPVVSPHVPKERLQTLAKRTHGFVYCTSRRGITGATSKFEQDLSSYVQDLKTIFGIPVAVGFGVKTREDVKGFAAYSDIVIAGSVFVAAIKGSKENPASIVEKTVRELIG